MLANANAIDRNFRNMCLVVSRDLEEPCIARRICAALGKSCQLLTRMNPSTAKTQTRKSMPPHPVNLLRVPFGNGYPTLPISEPFAAKPERSSPDRFGDTSLIIGGSNIYVRDGRTRTASQGAEG